MKKAGFITVSALLFVLQISVLTYAAGPEDPYYKQWASFNTGSNVTLVGKTENNTGIEAFFQTITLKEIGKDYLVIEIARSEEKSGSKVKKMKIVRFLDTKDRTEFRGQEEIDVAGKKLKCQRYTNTLTDSSGKEMMKFDYWFHPDIPGATRIYPVPAMGAIVQ